MTAPSGAEDAAPIVLSDDPDTRQSLAETVYETNQLIVHTAGLDLTNQFSEEKKRDLLGRIQAVISPTFFCIFGYGPAQRYSDVFDQISQFAERLSKDHIFPDGNKRTTVKVCLALLYRQGWKIRFEDSDMPGDNGLYLWVQSIVTGVHTVDEMAIFLREHAYQLD